MAFFCIPVSILRNQTYSIGYELSGLQNQQRQLLLEQKLLEEELSGLKAKIIDDTLKNKKMDFPKPENVIFYEQKNYLSQTP